MSVAGLVAREAAVGTIVNGVLSAAFAWLTFGADAAVPASALVADAVPQTFAVAFMATLVPTLLVRARGRRGVLPSAATTIVRLPRNAFVRALTVAIPAALIAWALHGLLLPGAASFAPGTVLIAKTIYGAGLGAMLTALTVRMSICEP